MIKTPKRAPIQSPIKNISKDIYDPPLSKNRKSEHSQNNRAPTVYNLQILLNDARNDADSNAL